MFLLCIWNRELLFTPILHTHIALLMNSSKLEIPPIMSRNKNRSTDLQKSQCEEKQHVYFLKVHKAGSTTIHNILSRFALVRNLNVMTLFTGFKSYPEKHFDHQLPPTPSVLANGKYDLYIEHSIYDENYLMTKLQDDTVNIAILRELMPQLRSSFRYYGLGRCMKIAKFDDPVAKFLENPEFHSSHNSKAHELTHNRIAKEFGYEEKIHGLKEYLSYIDSKFLVLLLERLPESLIVMKRKLCWTLKDILFSRARKQHYKAPKVSCKKVRPFCSKAKKAS